MNQTTIPLLVQDSGHDRQQQQQQCVVDVDDKNSNIRRRPPMMLKRAISVRERWEEIGVTANTHKYKSELLQKVAENEYETCEQLLQSGHDKVTTKDEETHETGLHIAAKNGFVTLMQLFLSCGADCNAQDSSGKSPLHLAATKDYFSCCQVLLVRPELEVNIMNRTGDTPLHHAAREGRAHVCLTILDHPKVMIDVQNKRGMTPLHLAAQEDHRAVISLLLNKGANWKQQDKYSYMPIHYAALKGFPESCEAILSFCNKNERESQLKAGLRDQKTPLMLAAKGGHHKCCVKLVNSNINAQDREGNTALFYAAAGGFENTVAELLKCGADPNIANKKGNSPILEAAGKRRVNCLQRLIEKNASVAIINKQGKTVLHQAAQKNAQECLLLLLDIPEARKHLDSKDTEDCTPLHTAIKQEAVECANYLLEQGASPTKVCKGGMTPLHLAADKGYTSVCEKLLANSLVHVSQENCKKATPLHLAAMHGSVDVCQMLLRKGARVTAVDENGRSALHIASIKGHDSVIRFLAKKGVPQRAKDDTGNTGLHLAASGGWLESCQVLVNSAKALVSDADHNGNLPLDTAFEKKHDEVFKFLLMQLPLKKDDERAFRLHQYMHSALKEKRLIVVEAIIDSAWWEAGFSGENGHHCFNFQVLLEERPHLALKAQNNCIQRTDSDAKVTYDFRFFEFNYYVEGAGKAAKSPYDESNGTVVKHAKQFIVDGLEWKRVHPVSLMIKHHRTHLLHHPLTKAWLVDKWNLYISYIFLALLFIEFLFVVSLTIFMAKVDDWAHVERRCNMTRGQFCSHLFAAAENADVMEVGAEVGAIGKCRAMPRNIAGWLFLLNMTFIILLLEGNYVYRLKREYLSMDNSLRIVEVILTVILLMPLGGCEVNYQVIHKEQWQCGIIALLLAWLLLISKLNQLPVFSVFVPITTNFIKSFVKVLSYILLLLGLFAFIFYLLLSDQSAFSTMPQAMVKTIVWLLGDLGYDDTFLNPSHELVYPATANFLFVVFVTTISGFIVNLFVTQPSEKLEDFRKRTAFHNAASQSRLVLQLDVCFPYFRKQRTRITVTSTESEKSHSNILAKILLKFYTAEEEEKVEDPLLKKLEEQHCQISQLLSLHMEQKEDIRDLKHQLNYIIRNMSGQQPFERT
ncbi:hypothetical protein O3P69_004023 [Scylla paramamosain]|uniref:Ion transport domain-containing protein n=2 Tax=Scylla paramamosain TaxID=85552 RepID=A0AAW0UGI3_SCYPA